MKKNLLKVAVLCASMAFGQTTEEQKVANASRDPGEPEMVLVQGGTDRKSTRLNSSH